MFTPSAMLKKIIYIMLLVVLVGGAGGVGFFVGKTQAVAPNVCKPDTLDFSLFWDAYNTLQSHYISPEKIDNQKVVYGAIAGMTKSLGDPYTTFFSPEEAKMFQQNLEGSFEGIGAEVGLKKEQLTIIAPLKGAPAESAGLKAGDYIVSIDKKSTSDMTVEQAVTLIRGKKGTPVTLNIFREGWTAPKDITITRDTIKVNSVTWELKNGNVAYVQMHQFDSNLSPDFRKIALEILKSPAQKIVLDLRNNPGGYLEVAQDVAGWFMDEGQIVTIEDFGKGKAREFYKTNGNGSLKNYPTVILINKGSASASEILAGSLRDNRGVKLIGEKSFGKGSVQDVQTLHDGLSFLKVTIAKWLTPKGNSISEVGLTPDIKVDNSDSDVKNGQDTQLTKALEIIRDLK